MNDVFFGKTNIIFWFRPILGPFFLFFIVIRAPNRAPATGARRRAPESRPARGYPEWRNIAEDPRFSIIIQVPNDQVIMLQTQEVGMWGCRNVKLRGVKLLTVKLRAANLRSMNNRGCIRHQYVKHQRQRPQKKYTPGPTPNHQHISPPRRQAPPPPRNNQGTPPKTLKNRTPPSYPANSSNTQHINRNNQIPRNNQSPLDQDVNHQYLNQQHVHQQHSNQQYTNRNSMNEPLQNHQTNNMSTPKAARNNTKLEKSHQPRNINSMNSVSNVNTPEPMNQNINQQNVNQQNINQQNVNQQNLNQQNLNQNVNQQNLNQQNQNHQQKRQSHPRNHQPLNELNLSAVQNTPTPVTLTSESPPKSTFKVPNLPKSFSNMSIPRDTQSLHSSTPKRITFNTVANSETSTIGESPYELELPEKQWFQALIVAQSGKTAQMLEHIYLINKENNPYNKLAEWHDPLTGYNVLHFAIIRGDSDLLKLATEKFHVRIDTKTSTSGDNALHLAIKSSNLHLIEQIVRCPGGQTLYKSRNDQGLKPIDYMKTYCMPQFLSNNEDFADIKKLLMKGTRAVTGVNQRSFGNNM